MNLRKVLFSSAILLSLNSFSQNFPVKINKQNILTKQETPTAKARYTYRIDQTNDPLEKIIYKKGITHKDSVTNKKEIIIYALDLNNDKKIDAKGYYYYLFPPQGKRMQIVNENQNSKGKWPMYINNQEYNKDGKLINETEYFDFNGDKVIDFVRYTHYEYENNARKEIVRVDKNADGIIDN